MYMNDASMHRLDILDVVGDRNKCPAQIAPMYCNVTCESVTAMWL